MSKRSDKPRDLNALAAAIVDEATSERAEGQPDAPATAELQQAQAAGRRGGLKGGRVRADRLTPERRSEIARKAAQTRWSSRKD